MKLISIGKFAEITGVTTQTLRNWDKDGELKPTHVTAGGTRYYSQEQANMIFGKKVKLQKERQVKTVTSLPKLRI